MASDTTIETEEADVLAVATMTRRTRRGFQVLSTVLVSLGLGLCIVAATGQLNNHGHLMEPLEGLLCVSPFLLGPAAFAHWLLRRLPHRIEARATGLTFVARSGTRTLAWDELRSVKEDSREHLRWHGGKDEVLTSGHFDGMGHLLQVVREHAVRVEFDLPRRLGSRR